MSNAITEIDNTDLVFIFGYNPADSHPIVANHVINAKRNGAKIIVCDPRKIETARIADMHIALKNGSNIALLNAIGHVIIEEDLYDKSFVASRSEGFEEYRKIVEGYTPESVEEITGELRRRAKAVNFGIVYGISGFSLAQDIGVSRQEASDYMEKYLETFSGVRAYMDRVKEQAKKAGYVATLLGRRRWLPELKSSNYNLRSFGERVALNMPIQGTAADVMKLAMIRVAARLKAEGLRARLVLQVHDELIVECPQEETEQVKALLTQEMEGAGQFSVPLVAEAGAGHSWAQAKG